MNAPLANSAAVVFNQLVADRHSCRGFRTEALPRSTIEAILAIAQRTASWCNAQPWQVAIVSGLATTRFRDELLAYVASNKPSPDFPWPAEYRGIYNDRRRECGLQLYEATGVARGDRAAADRQRIANFHFFGAPHVAVITSETALGVYGAVDCGAYVSNFMLAARAHGVASIAQAALAAYPNFWREHLKLDADRRVVCGISFGLEDTAHPANRFRTSRASIAQAATWIE